MPASPTLTFPTDLDDATKWKCVKGVPVFKPHTRVLPEFKDPTGKVWPEIKITVREADLAYIATETNKAGPQPMRCGHVVQDPTYPEKLQPKIEGWEKNHQTGKFSQDGGRTWEPCVTADLYYRLSNFDEVGPEQYPFRSVDYDFDAKKLTGLALLRRRPFLDLGVIPYAHRPGGTIVQYAFETNPGATPMDDDKFTPEEEAQYSRMCKYMAKKHPRMAAYMEGMSGNSTAPYAAENEQLKQKLATEQSMRLLETVKGKVVFNEQKELATLAALPEANRPAHVQYMLENYRPVANATGAGSGAGNGTQQVQVATGTGTGGGSTTTANGERAMSQAQMTAALQYASAGNIPWEAARAWALSNVKG